MPSRLAEYSEMTSLINSMASTGRGIFMLTKGSKTSIRDIRGWMTGTNRPAVVAALFHNPISPDSSFRQLKSMSEATSQGIEMWGQVSCRPLTMEFTMKSPYLFEGFSSWKSAMEVNSVEEYKKIWTKKFGKEFEKQKIARTLLQRLDNNSIDKLFGQITPEIIKEISENDDFDFHTSSIIKMLGLKNSMSVAQTIIGGEIKKLLHV